MIPIIIIGAGRSGTNILRDILAASPRATTWPCDEINYAWRYGNRSSPTDELSPADVKPRTRRHMRRLFRDLADRTGAEFVIEKTCANSLRVQYVAEIFPEARFVTIERDPVDVVASAMRRWRGELDLEYVADKVKLVPKLDLPYYAARYGWHRLRKVASPDGVLPTWGPRFEGIDELVKDEPLHVVCAAQWRACRTRAVQAFAALEPAFLPAHVAYSELAKDPAATIAGLTGRTFGSIDEASLEFAREHVSVKSVGRGYSELSDSEIEDIFAVLATAP